MFTASAIKGYIAELVSTFHKIDLMDFLHEMASRHFPDQRLDFMEYFMALCGDDVRDQFIVPHEKLIEFGIATSDRSSNIYQRLIWLDLVEGKDFELLRTQHLRKQGGTSTKNTYHLTPLAFKLCLIRAKKSDKQTIDVHQYAMYFLFVEEVVKFYDQYQRDFVLALSKAKDDKIDLLNRKIDEMREMASAQDAKMGKLLGYAEDTKNQLTEMNAKFDSLFDFTSGFARAMLSTWNGSAVFKTQVDHLIKEKDLSYALNHLKVMFTVAFYRTNADIESDFVIYFCCTNADVCKRIPSGVTLRSPSYRS